MTRARTRLAAGALTAALLGLATGCGAMTGDETETPTGAPQPNLLDKSELSVCTDMPYEPFEFEKKDGSPAGFDVDLVQHVADRLGVELRMVDTSFDDISSGDSLNNGKCDLAISAMTITGERARVLNFSSPYFDAAQAMVVNTGSGISSLKDLAGGKIGVQGGTTGELYLTDHAPDDAKVVPFEDAAAIDAAMKKGDVDAAVYDNTVVGDVVKSNKNLEVAAEFDTGEQYGMAVRRNGNVELLQVVNDVLADLKQDGTYDEIFTEWFGKTGA